MPNLDLTTKYWELNSSIPSLLRLTNLMTRGLYQEANPLLIEYQASAKLYDQITQAKALSSYDVIAQVKSLVQINKIHTVCVMFGEMSSADEEFINASKDQIKKNTLYTNDLFFNMDRSKDGHLEQEMRDAIKDMIKHIEHIHLEINPFDEELTAWSYT